MAQPGEVGGTVRKGHHLRTVLVVFSSAWSAAFVLALAFARPGVLLALLVLLAVLPTVIVPATMLVDAWRVHRRLSAGSAELEARLSQLLEAKRLRDDFAALVGHDLRTPPAGLRDPGVGMPAPGRQDVEGGTPPLGHRSTWGGATTPQGFEP